MQGTQVLGTRLRLLMLAVLFTNLLTKKNRSSSIVHVKNMSEFYFAYGSNLNAARMKNRKAFYTERAHAILQGYKLVFAFNSGSGFGSATIVPDRNSDVHGALYTLENGGLAKLDIFEWVTRGGYRRLPVQVLLDNGDKVECISYVATEAYTKTGLIPSKQYLGHLLEGKDILPKAYYEMLENHECGQ